MLRSLWKGVSSLKVTGSCSIFRSKSDGNGNGNGIEMIYPDAKLFTPGPIQISEDVRMAMSSENFGSREPKFVDIIEEVRHKLIDVAGLDPGEYTPILLQGSGTYGVEAAIQTFIPDDARVLVLINGAFAHRIEDIVNIYHLNHKSLLFPEDDNMNLDLVGEAIADYHPTHVVMVHSETSTGVINPVKEIGEKYIIGTDIVFMVDGMSSFGGIDVNIKEAGITHLMTSPNKCLECVPGIAVVFSQIDRLVDHSRTLSLNLYAQYEDFLAYSQFRFTPPIEVILGLDKAVDELLEETIEKRALRYVENSEVLRKGMKELGFNSFLPDELNGPIVHSYTFPENNFDFNEFYEGLYGLGCKIYIYPRKRTGTNLIRIGAIGQINKEDVGNLLKGMKIVKERMNFY